MEEIVYYQISDKYSTGSVPVKLDKFISEFGIESDGDLRDKSYQTYCCNESGEIIEEDFIYFKKVNKYKKKITNTYKIDNIEFGV